MAIIRLENVNKIYTSHSGTYQALKNIFLEIEKGEFCSIVGKSGSGKSTLLHLLGTLDKPSAGKIYVNEQELSAMSVKEQSKYRNHYIGYVFQDFQLEDSYTVYQNIEVPLLIGNIRRKERRQRIENILEEMDIIKLKKKYPFELSGGEKQRTAIARALINNPDIVLADEPCGNLDTKNSEIIFKILQKLSKDRVTVIMVTHDIETAMRTDKMVQLIDGKIEGINVKSCCTCQ